MFDSIIDFFANTPIVQGGFALMVAGWIGYQLRELPSNIWSFIEFSVIRSLQIRDSHPHFSEWLAFLTENAIRKGGPRTLEVRADWACSEGERVRSRLIAGTDSFWARVFGVWCQVRVSEDQTSKNAPVGRQFTIYASFYLCSPKALQRIMETVTQRAVGDLNQQQVDIMSRYGGRSITYIPKRDPRTLCLPRGMFESLEHRLREFCASKEQYEWAGIPWRFGVLFAGPPGTGKTSLTQALASRLGLRIAVVSLTDMRCDQDLITAFSSIEGQALVLLEDVDCAFAERQGEDAEGVSFSGLLNCIDGVLAPHNGRVLVMTTNHVERLDPALIRPGRVDLHVEVGAITKQDASDFVDRVFPHVALRHDIVAEVMQHPQPTPAMLLNRITRERWHKPARGSAQTAQPFVESNTSSHRAACSDVSEKVS